MTVGVAAQLDLPDLDARKWHFPKEFHAETTFDESKIYPQRAPDGGGAKGRVIDNRWITPCAPPLPPAAFMYAAYPLGPLARYSPYLLLKYHCHLNVEVYKYYFKYLYKHAARGPAMWVAFCKLRRSLKPALKDRRAISAQLS